METLLTSSESLAFQSFLASVDSSQPPQDWATYASQFNPDTIQGHHQDDMLDPLPPRQDSDLTKATKDLMSLDPGMWPDNGMLVDAIPGQPPQYFDHRGSLQHTLPHHGHAQQSLQLQAPQPMSFSTAHDTFPFLSSRQQQPHQHPDQYQHQQQPYMLDRIQGFDYASQNAHHGPPLSGPGSIALSNSSSQSQHPPHPHNPPPPSVAVPPASGPSKRPIRAASVSRASSSSSTPTAGPSTSKRSSAERSSSTTRSSQTNGGSNKPALLSPSQKKANHIQSEQKRRANIRRGYEALCETVPALREAIREEEEEARAAALASAAGLNGKSKPSKKRNGAKKKDGEDGGKDKIDGRAGPRSENVVLSKTIDYINDLLSDKAALLSRLQRARSMLPPGHPALNPLSPNPLWEREWKGGEGKEGNEDGEESEDGEDDNDDDASSTAAAPAQSSGSRKKGKNSDS